MFVKLPEVEMYHNDWLLKREAEERITARLREAEANRLATIAIQSQRQVHSYQSALVRLGEILSRAGDYLQTHFGSGLPVEANHLSVFQSSNKLSTGSTHPTRQVDCT